MKKSEAKRATTQQLIEDLLELEGTMVARNGNRVKGIDTESRVDAAELAERKIIDLDSFLQKMEQ